MLDSVGNSLSLFALTPQVEEAPNDARLVTTGFLERPRNFTSKQENRPTISSQ